MAINGSGGCFLFVSPQAIDARNASTPGLRGFEGAAIEISNRHSDQNGDWLDKAQILARVFPAFWADARAWLKGFDFPKDACPFGPYPSDRLTHKSRTVVEYTTPPESEGLGTHSSLKRNGDPIQGVAILSGKPPDVVLLSARIPRDTRGLATEIIRQMEREFEGLLPASRGRNAPPVRGE